MFGSITVLLYSILFIYKDAVVDGLCLRDRAIKRMPFFPIAIAILFSLAHGSFTGYFWDALGLKAAEKAVKKK